MHMLGAVQDDAPNSLAGHCSDESDVMCYGAPAQMRQVCPTGKEPLFDCGNNDYFNPGANLTRTRTWGRTGTPPTAPT